MLSFKNSDTVSRSKAGSKSVITFKNSISLSSRGNKSRSTESVTWNLQLSPAKRPVRGRSKSQNWDAQLLLPPPLAPWDSQANTAACSHGEELEGPRPPLRQQHRLPITGDTHVFHRFSTARYGKLLFDFGAGGALSDFACSGNTYCIRIRLGSCICYVLQSISQFISILPIEIKLCSSVRKMSGMLGHWLTKRQLP